MTDAVIAVKIAANKPFSPKSQTLDNVLTSFSPARIPTAICICSCDLKEKIVINNSVSTLFNIME